MSEENINICHITRTKPPIKAGFRHGVKSKNRILPILFQRIAHPKKKRQQIKKKVSTENMEP